MKTKKAMQYGLLFMGALVEVSNDKGYLQEVANKNRIEDLYEDLRSDNKWHVSAVVEGRKYRALNHCIA
jgi:hypothetical protein